jgi:TP901 family phage tail tape measure protein
MKSTVEAELLLTARDATGSGLRSASNRVRTTSEEIGRAFRGLVGGIAVVETARRALMAVGTAAIETDRQLNSLRITAGATSAEIEAMRKTLVLSAGGVHSSTRDLTESVNVLVQAGQSLDSATRSVPSIALAAKASAAEMEDMNNTAVVLLQNLGATPESLERFFDIAIKGGKLGRFELKNMAKELPSLSASAQQVGLVGEEGFAKLIAMLQIERQFAGTGEEAANNLRNLFDKMLAPTTVKNLEKFGVNWVKTMKAAKREGKDLTETFVDMVAKVTKGDPVKISQILPDREARTGLLALIQGTEKYKDLVEGIRDSLGETARDAEKAFEGAAAGVDHLATAYSNFLDAVASRTKPTLETAAEAVADFVDKVAVRMTLSDQFAEAFAKANGGNGPDAIEMLPTDPGGREIARIERLLDAGKMTPEEARRAALDYGTIRGADLAFKTGGIDAEQYREMTRGAVLNIAGRNGSTKYEPPQTRPAAIQELQRFANATRVNRVQDRIGSDLLSPARQDYGPTQEPNYLSGGDSALPGRFVTREEWEQRFSPMPGLPRGPMTDDRALLNGPVEAVIKEPIKAEFEGKATVDVRVRVEGPGTIVGASSSSSGHIQTNVGTSMPGAGKSVPRRDE